AAAVCLEDQLHRGRARLVVIGEYEASFGIVWPVVTDQMRRCYNDLDEGTENGACGVATSWSENSAGSLWQRGHAGVLASITGAGARRPTCSRVRLGSRSPAFATAATLIWGQESSRNINRPVGQTP